MGLSFEGMCALDTVFFRVAGDRHWRQIPMIELSFPPGSQFNYKESTEALFVIDPPPAAAGKPAVKALRYSKAGMVTHLTHELFGGQLKVTDCVIQPAGEPFTPEVIQFRDK